MDKEKYGKVASWAIWDTPFSLEDFSKVDGKINLKAVLVAFCPSGEIEKDFKNFHPFDGRKLHPNTERSTKKLIDAFQGTEYDGVYMTDIIKYETVRGKVKNLVSADEIMAYIEEHPEIRDENIRKFKEELEFIGLKDPFIIAFGPKVFRILRDFPNVCEVPSYFDWHRNNGEGEYKKAVWKNINLHLASRGNKMNTDLFNVVKQIVAQRGESVLSEPEVVSDFLANFAQDVEKKEKIVLKKCLEHKFAQTLRSVDKAELANCKQRMAAELHNEEGLDADLCRNTVDLLARVLFGEENSPSIDSRLQELKRLGKECGEKLDKKKEVFPRILPVNEVLSPAGISPVPRDIFVRGHGKGARDDWHPIEKEAFEAVQHVLSDEFKVNSRLEVSPFTKSSGQHYIRILLNGRSLCFINFDPSWLNLTSIQNLDPDQDTVKNLSRLKPSDYISSIEIKEWLKGILRSWRIISEQKEI